MLNLKIICIGFALLVLNIADLSADDDVASEPINFTPGATVDFAFQSSGLSLSGIFDVPDGQTTEALIIIVHSYGETDVRNWYSYADQRKRFNDMGIATALWDKPGLGLSEGTFDINQSVHESGQEVLDAVAYLRDIGAPGSHKIGLWGGSRAGWIAPIALSQDSEIDFWVSISGTAEEDNYPYLLLSNLPYEGGSFEEAEALEKDWRKSCEIYRTKGSYTDYVDAISTLRANDYFNSMGAQWPTQSEYEDNQKLCQDGQCLNYGDDLCGYVSVQNFGKMLSSLNVDVLAIFGEKDLNVDPFKTEALYRQTIGQNPDASLVIKTFADADHSLNVTKTGSIKEMRAASNPEKIKGYYEVQISWLQKYVLNKD